MEILNLVKNNWSILSLSNSIHPVNQVNSNEITISLKSKLERGKANREMIENIAEYFRISKDIINIIISGLASNRKLIEIS